VPRQAPDLGTVFTGDTLFNGGPGATASSFSDTPTILTSIRTRLPNVV
jgi:glyoxylase-like metal-dependent hydrolase (beta-lactamase superfamily II)